MEPRQLALFEALAGGLLDDLGLERSESRVSAAVDDEAAGYLERWQVHLERRAAKASRRARRAAAGGQVG
jgi:hypothetical protein